MSNEQRKQNQLIPSKLLGVIPTLFRQNTTDHTDNLAVIQKHFGALTWDPVALRTVWGQASGVRRTLFSYAPDDVATQEAWAIVNRVEEMLPHAS